MRSDKTNKVVTITLNPALDLTGSLAKVNIGTVSLVEKGSLHAAGKGVNVAKVLSDLGAEVTVTGFLGKENPELFQQLFNDIKVKDSFVRIKGATRINVKLVENNHRVSDINFPGFEVSENDIEQFESVLFALAKTHDYFVLAGSLPKGLTPERCASWIENLNKQGKRVLFDSSKAALRAGIQSSPWLIKPNDEELSDLLGKKLDTAEKCQQAAEALSEHGIDNIVISMGAKGVMWLNNNQWLQAKPPLMQIVSTVGAGDTLVAGLCWGHMQQMPKAELLGFATALSALAVNQVGVGLSSKAELAAIQQQTQVSELSLAPLRNENL